MKRLLLILIVIFIFPNNISAKDLDVQVVSKNSNGDIFFPIHDTNIHLLIKKLELNGLLENQF